MRNASEEKKDHDLSQCCQTAKFDPFLSLVCARVEGVGVQSKERKGSTFAVQHSGAIVLQAQRAKHMQSKKFAIQRSAKVFFLGFVSHLQAREACHAT